MTRFDGCSVAGAIGTSVKLTAHGFSVCNGSDQMEAFLVIDQHTYQIEHMHDAFHYVDSSEQ